MSTTDTSRKAFEAFFLDSRRNRGASKRPTFDLLPDGTYADDHTQRHWWTWQQAASALTADAERTARNRDMWKGQCERQAAELERLRRGEFICQKCGLRKDAAAAGPVPF